MRNISGQIHEIDFLHTRVFVICIVVVRAYNIRYYAVGRLFKKYFIVNKIRPNTRTLFRSGKIIDGIKIKIRDRIIHVPSTRIDKRVR